MQAVGAVGENPPYIQQDTNDEFHINELFSWNRAGEVAKITALVAFGVFLFYCNASFFLFGAVVGLVFTDEVELVVQKVELIIRNMPYTFAAICSFGGIFAFPIFLATGALFYGGWATRTLINSAVELDIERIDAEHGVDINSVEEDEVEENHRAAPDPRSGYEADRE